MGESPRHRTCPSGQQRQALRDALAMLRRGTVASVWIQDGSVRLLLASREEALGVLQDGGAPMVLYRNRGRLWLSRINEKDARGGFRDGYYGGPRLRLKCILATVRESDPVGFGPLYFPGQEPRDGE